MAQIILQILAVLGIILLCLLGLCLTLFLLILFVPLRYRLSGKKSGQEMEGRIRISWFLHLLSVSYAYPLPGEMIVRVAGIRVRSIKVNVPQRQEAETAKDIAESINTSGAVPESPTAPETVKENSDAPETVKETPGVQENGRKEKRIAALWNRIRKWRDTLCRAWNKVKEILENIEYYRDLLLQKENRLLYGRCWKQVRRVLHHMRPRTIKADLVVGTGAPDTTGYLLAVYGMMLPLLGNHINIVPDFNAPVLEGNLFLKGRIALFVLLHSGIKILLDKQLHGLIRKLKREEK